ncbi:DUF1465 family protein [Thalassobaculum sp.]|uniref:DUF1465 family protein n=1 Tax=Thalassobaculum sp. TaxID=2022740 RepID=UPI0032ED2617
MVFDGTYREVLALLEEARELAATRRGAGVPGGEGLSGEKLYRSMMIRLEASCEAFRVTSRLSHCLAWVMVQRAIQEGELSHDAALDPRNRLDGGPVCLELGGEANPYLPQRLRALLAASRKLYARLARLDARVSSSASAAVAPAE